MTGARADLALAMLLTATFAAAAALALRMPWQAAALPLLVAGAGIALGASLVLAQLRGTAPGRLKTKPRDAEMAGWFLAATAAVLLAGFQIGGFVFVLVYTRFAAGYRWPRALALALPAPVLAWLAFAQLLGRPGFDGLLLP